MFELFADNGLVSYPILQHKHTGLTKAWPKRGEQSSFLFYPARPDWSMSDQLPDIAIEIIGTA